MNLILYGQSNGFHEKFGDWDNETSFMVCWFVHQSLAFRLLMRYRWR